MPFCIARIFQLSSLHQFSLEYRIVQAVLNGDGVNLPSRLRPVVVGSPTSDAVRQLILPRQSGPVSLALSFKSPWAHIPHRIYEELSAGWSWNSSWIGEMSIFRFAESNIIGTDTHDTLNRSFSISSTVRYIIRLYTLQTYIRENQAPGCRADLETGNLNA